jgi:hypothetical protein
VAKAIASQMLQQSSADSQANNELSRSDDRVLNVS